MQQGSNGGGTFLPPKLPLPGTSAQTATLTDEQILGLDEGAAAGGANAASLVNEAAGRSGGCGGGAGLADQGGLAFDDVLSARAQRGVIWRLGARRMLLRARAWRAGGRGEAEPAWLAALETQPAAAAEARRWRDAARDISSIDSAYFSSDPGARSGLADRLYQSDPAAFRAMLAESARTLAARDPQGLAELARQLGMPEAAAPLRPRSVSQAAQPAAETQRGRRRARDNAQPNVNSAAASTNNGAAFPAEAYRAFESSTNEDVGRRMHEAIDRTLASTLPEGHRGRRAAAHRRGCFSRGARFAGERSRVVAARGRNVARLAIRRRGAAAGCGAGVGAGARRAAGSGAASGGRVDFVGAGFRSRQDGADRFGCGAAGHHRRAAA